MDVDDLMDVFSPRSHAIDIWSTLVAIEFAWSSGSFQGFRVKLCLFVNMNFRLDKNMTICGMNLRSCMLL